MARSMAPVVSSPLCRFCSGHSSRHKAPQPVIGYSRHQTLPALPALPRVVAQERVLFERKLAKFLLPGPLTYCSKADLILTYSSRMELECYKYSSISAGGHDGSTRRLSADWSASMQCAN